MFDSEFPFADGSKNFWEVLKSSGKGAFFQKGGVFLWLVMGLCGGAGGGVVEREVVKSGRELLKTAREVNDGFLATTSFRPKRRNHEVLMDAYEKQDHIHNLFASQVVRLADNTPTSIGEQVSRFRWGCSRNDDRAELFLS